MLPAHRLKVLGKKGSSTMLSAHILKVLGLEFVFHCCEIKIYYWTSVSVNSDITFHCPDQTSDLLLF